jgi:hypothetical protein
MNDCNDADRGAAETQLRASTLWRSRPSLWPRCVASIRPMMRSPSQSPTPPRSSTNAGRWSMSRAGATKRSRRSSARRRRLRSGGRQVWQQDPHGDRVGSQFPARTLSSGSPSTSLGVSLPHPTTTARPAPGWSNVETNRGWGAKPAHGTMAAPRATAAKITNRRAAELAYGRRHRRVRRRAGIPTSPAGARTTHSPGSARARP